MTITEIRTHAVRAPMHTEFVTAIRRTKAVDSLLIEIVDDSGHTGWGEGVQTWKITGDSLAGMAAAITGPLSEGIIGRNIADLDALTRNVETAVVGNTAAKAAVDIALHDLAARTLGVPLARLFGSSRTEVATDVTLAAGSVEDMAAAGVERISEGFKVLKLKVGDGGADDVRRLRDIRSAVGPDTILRLDANQGWTPRQAVRIIGTLEDAGLDIELVEQPVAAGDLDGLAYVSERVGTPILADEAVWSASDLLEVIRRRAADLVNIKLAKSGGLRGARRLLSVAEAAGTGVVLGSMMETHVGIGAIASLATVVGGSYVHDLDAAWWLKRSPVVGGPRYDGATLILSSAPGLGIEGLAE